MSALDPEVRNALIVVGTIYFLLAIVTVVGVCLALLLLARRVRFYLRMSGKHAVRCPETGTPAIVCVNALRTAIAVRARPNLRVTQCSRWPAHAACGQYCVAEIQTKAA